MSNASPAVPIAGANANASVFRTFAMINGDLRERGFCFVKGAFAGDRELLDLAGKLGTPVAEPRDGVVVKSISPSKPAGAPRNTLSATYGAGSFPFHTDAAYWGSPPAFVVFSCEAPGGGKRPTLLVDTHEWRLGMPERRALSTEVWLVRRVTAPFLCVHETSAAPLGVRVDYDCMVPAVRRRSAAQRIVREAVAASTARRIDWHAGDILVVDNSRMLHARGEAECPDEDRILKRVLVHRRGTP